MLQRLAATPIPVLRRPEIAATIPAVGDELEVLGVGHVVDIDLEGWHVHPDRAELVVPAERDAAARRAQRRSATSDANGAARRRRTSELVREIDRLVLVLLRQAVPHVEQRLLVHGLVLQGGEDRLAVLHRRPVLDERRIAQGAQDRLVGGTAEREDLAPIRPDRRRAAARNGGVHAVRVDAAGEQLLEPLVHARVTEAALEKRDDAEGWKVPFVEHDRVPEGDRTGVIDLRIDQVEEPPGSFPVPQVPLDERDAGDGQTPAIADGHGHSSFHCFDAGHHRRDSVPSSRPPRRGRDLSGLYTVHGSSR